MIAAIVLEFVSAPLFHRPGPGGDADPYLGMVGRDADAALPRHHDARLGRLLRRLRERATACEQERCGEPQQWGRLQTHTRTS